MAGRLTGTGPGGGKAANSRKNVGRRPGERGLCYILERWSGKFEQRCESEQEKSVNRAGEYGTGNLCRDCRFSLVLYNYVIHKNHTV